MSCGSAQVGMSTLDSALYVRADTDHTTVYAPRVHAAGKLGDSAGVDVTYTMDSWTGASIDVVTAATTAIHELRHEINAGAYYEFSNVTISGGYRHSRENDYWSNGGVVNVITDMADNNTTLALSLLGSKDIVGRSGDDWVWARKPQESLGGRVTLSQVLDTKTVLQLSWETIYLRGYLSSPYRFVAVGPYGTCKAFDDTSCFWEVHPRERLRNAGVINLRRAFGGRVSIGVSYRFYFDDWGVLSHTVAPDLALLVGEHGTFKLDYRYYNQGAASFYRSYYTEIEAYLTRDRKLSPLYSNRVGLEYLHSFELGESKDTVLSLAGRAGVTRFRYLNFLGLEQVDALELTGLVGFDFR